MKITPREEHALAWSDRLQDWLDGDVEAGERAAVESHVQTCEQCSALLAELRKVDEALRSAAPPIALDERFDARLFAQIDAIGESQRAAARQRIEQELQQQLTALARSWKRTLLFVIPGVIGGVALAFTIAGYFMSAEIAQPIVATAGDLTRTSTDVVQTLLTAMLGAGVGAGVARWLASVAE